MPSERPRSNDPADLVGRVLSDRYRLDELIAAGSIGAVYRARHLNMRKDVAVKVLHPRAEGFPELVARFEREALVGAHIAHPNIASASDMGTFDDGSYFLVHEFVRGHNLREVIDRDGPLAPDRVSALLRQLAEALVAAHAHGVLHRDIKPLNIMVTDGPRERIKLIDFGLARVQIDRVAPAEEAETERVSTPDLVFGTVDYMAPEIHRGMLGLDERADLYSLGITAYEMLTAKHPFEAASPMEMLERHREGVPPPCAIKNPSVRVPPALEAIVMRLLEKDPADRYDGAAQLVEAIDALSLPPEGASSPRAFSTQDLRRVPEKRSGMWRIGAVALVFVGVGVLLAATFFARPKPPTEALPPPPVDPSASALATTTAPPPAEDLATTLKRDLVTAAETGDAAEGAAILTALSDVDAAALADPATRKAAAAIAIAAGEQRGDAATEAFYALSYRFGSDGLDVLWDVSENTDSTRAASRARAILEVQASSERASKALRIAVELRRAPCRRKTTLFSRAGTDGDARVLRMLEAMHPPSCEPDGALCCYRRHLGLERTITSLRERLDPVPN